MNEILQKRIEEAAQQCATTTDGKIISFAYLAAKQMADWLLQNQWISVEEGLPEEGDIVLVTGGHHRTLTAIYYKETGFVSSGIVLSSTHWMQIPQLKGGEK